MRKTALLVLMLLPILALAWTAWAHDIWEPTAGRTGAVGWSRLERAGREHYRAEMCWQCHANFIRPIDDERRQWGPVPSAAGTLVGPDLRGGIRFGADLTKPPSWRSEDWLYAKLYDPRLVEPRGVMPGSPHLFRPAPYQARTEVPALIATFDTNGDGRVSFVTDATAAWQQDGMSVARMSELDVAGLRAPPRGKLQSKSGEELWYDAEGKRAYEDVWQPGEEQGDGILSLRDIRPEPLPGTKAIVAYLMRVQEPVDLRAPELPHGEWIDGRGPDPQIGRRIYDLECAQCHGAQGRGDGPAGLFLDTPPTDLARGRLKYPGYASFLHGMPAAGMPGRPHARANDWTDIQVFLRGLRPSPPVVAQPSDAESALPPPSGAPAMELASKTDQAGYMKHVLRGKAVYVTLGCAGCHGTEGRGDGADAIAQFSDGRRIRARDFKPRNATDQPRRRLRGGARPEDIHRTIMNGLDTTGMPGAGKVFRTQEGNDGVLQVPLKDERLFEVAGVVASNASGVYEEILTKLTRKGFGDDWALVLYVLHLARTESEVAAGKMAWPRIEVAK